MAGCSDVERMASIDESGIIRVGGVSTGTMVTKAAATPVTTAAESLPWLKEGLAAGMDITYLTKTESRKARLKLEVDGQGDALKSEGGVTVYSLKAYD